MLILGLRNDLAHLELETQPPVRISPEMEGIKEMIKAAGADAPRFISKLFRESRPDYSSRASCWLLCRSLARKRVRKQGDNSRFHVRYVRSEKRHRFILVP